MQIMKYFFNISDLNTSTLRDIISNNIQEINLSRKNIGLIFEQYSTRTRLSFKVGISNLGGNTIDIRFEELNFSRDETFEDTFLALNCYLDGLIFRTNDHNKLEKCSKFFNKPIINALSDFSHPCQALSDVFTINEHFNSLKIKILWMGDMNNVCYSLMEAVSMIEELELYICCPKEIIGSKSWQSFDNIHIVDDINLIDLSSIKCVMTDVQISMNDKNDRKKMTLLAPYKVDSELMNKTSSDSIFMHCLPAKINQEVTEDVISGSKSIVWHQAYNRMIVQKKLLSVINWEDSY